jgi:hypothetical protein
MSKLTASMTHDVDNPAWDRDDIEIEEMYERRIFERRAMRHRQA